MKHLGEIFEDLYSTDSAENYAEQDAFQNIDVQTTKDKYHLAFTPLMSGGKKRS